MLLLEACRRIVGAYRSAGRVFRVAVVLLASLAAYGLGVWLFVEQAPLLGLPGGGLAVTGMYDRYPWGIYIGFFAFWVGVAASAFVYLMAGYGLGVEEFKRFLGVAEAVAVGALMGALLFIIVDLGRPLRAVLLIPGLAGFPSSMLCWDFIVLTTYALLCIAGYLSCLTGCSERLIYALCTAAAPVAIGIHAVTAFIFQSLAVNPYWHGGLMAPRFIATAFASGSALILIVLLGYERAGVVELPDRLVRLGVRVEAASLTAALFMTLSELQSALWSPPPSMEHRLFSLILYGWGWDAPSRLFWVWVVVGSAAVVLAAAGYSSTRRGAALISVLTLTAVAAEKALLLIIGGFVLWPFGAPAPYTPTLPEVAIALGVNAAALAAILVLTNAVVRGG